MIFQGKKRHLVCFHIKKFPRNICAPVNTGMCSRAEKVWAPGSHLTIKCYMNLQRFWKDNTRTNVTQHVRRFFSHLLRLGKCMELMNIVQYWDVFQKVRWNENHVPINLKPSLSPTSLVKLYQVSREIKPILIGKEC